jgi:hypothetical protein
MNLVPPWSLAKRQEWARAHPWVAACYFATLMSVFLGFALPVLTGSPASVRFKVFVAVVAWPVMAILFPVALDCRWGERPDAEASPPPSARRMWSRASDRFLLWWMWLGVVATVGWVVELVTGTYRSWRTVWGSKTRIHRIDAGWQHPRAL